MQVLPSRLVVFTDGGSRGNPGPAACAFVVFEGEGGGKDGGGGEGEKGEKDKKGEKGENNNRKQNEKIENEIWSQGFFLGVQTNNEAEYAGVLHALDWLRGAPQKPPHITWKLDSQLVVEQLSKRWKIKEPRLKELAQKCWQGLELLGVSSSFNYVPRSENARADALLNQTLDQV